MRYLDEEGEALLRTCQALEENGYDDDDIVRLNDNSSLSKHVERVSEKLNHDALLKLALLTWHFDASSQMPYQELLLFVAKPYDEFEALSRILCVRYNAQTGACLSHEEFGQKLADLLGFLEHALGNEWNLIWQCLSRESL